MASDFLFRDVELNRKFSHIVFGIMFIGLIKLGWGAAHFGFFALVLVCISMVSLHCKVPVFSCAMEHFERDCNKKKPNVGGISSVIGVMLSLLLFRQDVALASIIVFSLGDPVGWFVGTRFGRFKNPLNKKKHIEGYLAGSFCGFLGAFLFVEPIYAFIGSFGAMVFESFHIRIGKYKMDDNIYVPVVCGWIISTMMLIL